MQITRAGAAAYARGAALKEASWSDPVYAADMHITGLPLLTPLHDKDGRLIGIVHYIFHRSCWTAGPYVYLQDLFTSSDARGKGVGRALIEAVYAAAKAEGAARVHWLTHETNARAMVLYNDVADRSGFLQYRKVL